jgi:large subunit ribosomal protein L9
MKIILNEDVYNLGEEGDVCTVADGYARNFLLPKKLAVLFNNTNVAYFKSREASIKKKKEEKRKKALSFKESIEEMSLELRVSAGESGKLFGAVTAASIAEALAREGVHIEKKKIDVPSHSIKMVGTYTIKVRLYESETADLKIEIVNERAAELRDKAAAAAAKAAAKAAAGPASATAKEEVAQKEPVDEIVGYGDTEFADEEDDDEDL